MAGPAVALRLFGHERRIVAGALALVVLISVAFVLSGGGTGMSPAAMTGTTGPAGALIAGTPEVLLAEVWTPGYALVIFLMWWLMMVAMMVPSAAPTILLFAALNQAKGVGPALGFLAGYLAAWAGFSLVATALQAALAAVGLISPMFMTLALPWLGAIVLIGAGLYQFSPVKAACLDHCRGPVAALTRHRRTGRAAAFRMGLVHGRYCLGCCWALMALLFVGGVMNIWWIIGLTVYVAVEKLAPGGQRLTRPMGAALVVAGLALMARSAGVV